MSDERKPLWNEERMSRECFAAHVAALRVGVLTEDVITHAYESTSLKMRDEYEAALAEKDARIAALERKLSICSEYADNLRQDREAYIQYADERIAELERQLAEAQGDAEYWHGMYLNDGENADDE